MSVATHDARHPPLRLLHVLPSIALRAGGPAVCVAEMASAMGLFGIDSRILATNLPGPPTGAYTHAVTELELPAAARSASISLAPVRWPQRFAYAPHLRIELHEATVWADLLNIHSLFLYPQFAAWKAARAKGLPYVVTPHGALAPCLRKRGRMRKRVVEFIWQRAMLEGAAAIQVATDDEAELIADIAPGVPRIVLPHGVHVEAFRTRADPGAFRAKYLAGSTELVVLAHGRLARKKGLDILVRAFAALPAAHGTSILVLAGPDDEGVGAELRKLADALGVGTRLVLTGMLYPSDRLGALACASVWALPSHTENFAIAAMEALAAGVPVVVSSAINIAREVDASRAGLVARPDEREFTSAIDRLLSDPAMRAELSVAGRAFAEEYDWERVAKKSAAAYRALVASA